MYINWEKYFDKIFILSLADNIERREDLKQELNRVGINVLSTKVEFKITVKNEFYKYIWSNPNLNSPSWWLNMNVALNCTLGHYEIWKEAQALGYKRILILEDDVRFLNDISKIQEILENMPDFDICSFDGYFHTGYTDRKACRSYIQEHKVNPYYWDFSKVSLLGGACYALSEKAISSLIQMQEKEYRPTDMVINLCDYIGQNNKNDSTLIRVHPIENMAIQEYSYISNHNNKMNDDEIIDYRDYHVKENGN